MADHNALTNMTNFICEPSSTYRNNCSDPGWKGKKKGGTLTLAEFPYVLEKTQEDSSGKDRRIPYPVPWEAHHILSVSCVSNLDGLSSEQKDSVRRCCQVTTWDINDKDNLIALPLFGHTIKWYAIDDNDDAPGWENMPQHDWDHNSKKGYCHDVKTDLQKFYKTLEKGANGHKLNPKSIAADLNRRQTRFRTKIKERGQKGEGTHKEWQGEKNSWYKPFSMAANGCESVRPPARVKAKKDKLIKLLKLWKGT